MATKTHKPLYSVRRHAAIMFTDIVGYTAMMGSDEDRALEVLAENRKIHNKLIKQYNGTLIKEMGDGMLVSFDLASDAVRCAIEIQKAVKSHDIPLKIGIHEGEMVFEGNDVLGDGVNVASRIQESSMAGSIQISGSVYQDIKNQKDIQTSCLGEKSFKSIDDAMIIYEILNEKITTPNKKSVVVGTQSRRKSIIVLPFVNMSNDPEQEYFSDGLTEEIITDLSHIGELLVISRNSARTFKRTNKKTTEVAKEVNVQYVLEGSVRKAGNNLRITAQLIDAQNDTHLWAKKYSETLDDVFEIQERVSRLIMDSLKLKLSRSENHLSVQKTFSDIQVYEYYLKAKYRIWTWSDSGLKDAISYLQKGIDRIGPNILLYFGMGYVYWTYMGTGYRDKDECVKKVEKYAKKIFKIDQNSIHGHRLFGMLNLRQSNLSKGITHLKRVLEIDRNDSEALHWISISYCNAGKPDNAKKYADKLIQIDPLNPLNFYIHPWIETIEGRFKSALRESYLAILKSPEHPILQFLHAILLAYNNKLKDACSLLEKLSIGDPSHLWSQMGQCLRFAFVGDKVRTIECLEKGIKKKAREDLFYSWVIAVCDALINEKKEAINSLECAVNLGAINYPFFSRIDPFLENVRNETRFQKLMERVKFEWENFKV